MGRRSPILGYNHNVRYRGIVFHVQTEDSGHLNPHIFSHLFHGGVIVSTRKLVYDPDADDGVIKSLMQAQHKAVMKELRRGLFDDKIDKNLAGTPGLLPRGQREDSEVGLLPTAPSGSVPNEASLGMDGGEPMIELEAEDPSVPIEVPPGMPDAAVLEMVVDDDSEPSAPEITVTVHPRMTPPGVPAVELGSDPTIKTATPEMVERARPVDSVPPLPPPPSEPRVGSSPVIRRASTPPPISSASLPPIPPRTPTPGSTVRGAPPVPRQAMSQHPVVIRPASEGALLRDDVSAAFDTIQQSDAAEIHSPAPDSAPTPPGESGDRPGSYSAHRPERRLREEFRSQRMPQISAVPEPIRDKGGTGRVEQPAALRSGPAAPPPDPRSHPAIPKLPGPPAEGARGQPPRRPTPGSAAAVTGTEARPAAAPATARTSTPGNAAPAARAPTPQSGGVPVPSRTSTPPTGPTTRGNVAPPGRLTPATGVTVPRTRTPTAPRYSSRQPGQVPPQAKDQPPRARPSGGVVMSRPAVIVGGRSTPPAAASPPPGGNPNEARTQTAPRIRRAREEGGRGMFGQDLISEKSLDEVILAYLSEDATEE